MSRKRVTGEGECPVAAAPRMVRAMSTNAPISERMNRTSPALPIGRSSAPRAMSPMAINTRATRYIGASSETIIPGNHSGGNRRFGGTGRRNALTVHTHAAKNQVKKMAEINSGDLASAAASASNIV